MKRLIGYVNTEHLPIMKEKDIRALDVINIAFAHNVDGHVTWNHPECVENLQYIKKTNPQIKLILSVGGWSAGGFSEAASTEEGRKLFAEECLGLIEEYGLDGVDIDWEYLCFSVAGIGACPEDKENFTLLLKAIREVLEAKEAGRYMLTIAAGGDSYFIRNTHMDQVAEYLDYVQLMTYDLRGGFQLLTGHHTNLYSYGTDLFDVSTDKAVHEFIEAGVPREKIVIGAAFYYREWKNVPDVDHGLCQMAETSGTIGHSYTDLAENYINKNGFVRYWDDVAKAPWLFNGKDFISYDDEESLSCKIAYMKEQDLSGIMFWVYGEEQTFTLVQHMRKEINKNNYRIPKPDMPVFAPPTYQCRRATKPFVLDGNLDKEFWQDAEFTELFNDIEGDKRPKPRYATRAKMLWDDENLYVGAILEGDEIWGHQTERDCVIFLDNDFEIFIDPDSDTHQYYEFEMNAKNTVWDLLLTKTYRDGGKAVNGYDMHGMRSAVKIDGTLNDPSADNKQWSVEVVIPFSAIWECSNAPRGPKAGEYYRMNFSRVQWKVDVKDNAYVKRCDENGKVLPEDNWVWAPTGIINIHYPELWAFVFFTEGDETYEIPQDEYDKWELRRLYYNANCYYDEHGRFPASLEEINKDYDYTIDAVLESTKHTFEVRCDSRDGKRELVVQGDGKACVYEK